MHHKQDFLAERGKHSPALAIVWRHNGTLPQISTQDQRGLEYITTAERRKNPQLLAVPRLIIAFSRSNLGQLIRPFPLTHALIIDGLDSFISHAILEAPSVLYYIRCPSTQARG